MTYKRAMVIGITVLMAIAVMIVLMKCSSTEVMADLTGPPTIEMHLQSINSNLQFFKWAGGIISGLIALLIGSLGYAYKRDIGRLDKKAQVGIDLAEKLDAKYDSKIDSIEENFMSIETHKMVCHKH